MTTVEASARLNVTVRQVRRLVENGTIREAGRVGRSLLLDANSVLSLANQGTRHGRRWQANTAWAALALLDGDRETLWADSSRRWHLRQKLANMDSAELVRATRSRADVHRYRVSVSYLDDLTAEVTRTGLSALSDATIAHKLGMAVARTTDLDGYVNRDQIDDVIGRYFLADDAAGNLTLRVVNADNGLLRPGDVADLPVIALDLADSLDTRLNRAGHRYLDQLLGQL